MLNFRTARPSVLYTPSHAIPALIVVTAVLSLQKIPGITLIPYAPHIMLLAQAVFFMLCVRRLKYDARYNRYVLVYAMLVGFSFLSAIWSPMPGLVIKRAFAVFFQLLVMGALVLSDERPERMFRRLAVYFVGMTTILAVIGLVIYAGGDILVTPYGSRQVLTVGPISVSQLVTGRQPLIRISSLTGNPNALGMLLSESLPFVLYLIAARIVGRYAGATILGVHVLALVLTFSRASIMSALVGMALFLLLKWGRVVRFGWWRWMLGVAVVVLSVVSVSLWVLGDIAGGMLGVRLSLDLNDRSGLWEALFESVIRNPISGVGFGVSYEAILRPLGFVHAGHNLHLTILAEIGLAGYLLVVIAWLAPLYAAYRALRCVGEDYGLCAAIAVAGSLFLHQLFENSVLRFGFHNVLWGTLIFYCLRVAQETIEGVAGGSRKA